MIVSQRLVRKLCPDCKEAYEITPEQLKLIKLNTDLIYRPSGCAKCNQIGYKGRTCIAEVMVVNAQLRNLITQRESFQKIKEVARATTGMQTLFESAVKKLEEGVTSFEEALSVTLGGD